MKKLLFLLLVLCCNQIIAQINSSQQIHFNFLGIKEGLPEGTVTALLQDKEGYLWIGTQNGLVRYDGYKAKKYGMDANDNNSLNIQALYEDYNNDIWIGTGNGLYFYDRVTDIIVKKNIANIGHNAKIVYLIKEDSEKNLWILLYDNLTLRTSICLLDTKTKQQDIFDNEQKGNHFINAKNVSFLLINKNKIWISSQNKLFEYNPLKKHFISHYLSKDSLNQKTPFFLTQDSVSKFLWFFIVDQKVSKGEGLGRYNPVDNSLSIFHPSGNNLNTVSSDTAWPVLTDKKNRLWFTTGNGLSFYDFTKHGFTNIDATEKKKNVDDYYSHFSEDQNDNFWCPTAHGLLFYNTHNNKFTRYSYNEKFSDGLVGENIGNLILDRQGFPWFGVDQSGLQWINKSSSKFIFYKDDPAQMHHFPGGEVNSFAEAKDGVFWLSSTHGLYQWQPSIDSFTFIHYEKNLNKDVSTSQVMVDKEGLVWFTAYGNGGSVHGLYCYNPVLKKSKNYRYIEKDSLSLSNENIRSILEDKSGAIWIGTYGGGVCSFDKSSQKFTRYPYRAGDNISKPKKDSLDDDQVSTMHFDEQGTLWVGTNNGGLNKFDPKRKSFISYLNDLPGFLTVENINNDHYGNIWSGTYYSGLYSLNPKTNRLKKLSEKDGLLYDGCWGLQEDNYNNLWIASKRGFSIMNIKTNEIRNVTSANGLPEEPDEYGFYKASDGSFLYGCKDGFVSFNPGDFVPDTVVPVMHIEAVTFNDPQTNSSDKKDASVVRYGKDDIHLRYNENRITFSYVGLQYYDAAEVKYAYKLDGYDKDWVQAGNQRTATYTNLSPGTYTFHVKAANSDGVWTTKEDAFIVIITPPWWRTWWAYLIYATLFASILRAYIVFRSRSLRRHNTLLEQKVTHRTTQLTEANAELKLSQESIAAKRDELAGTIDELKSTQKQLIQSEKMASLGELTAGIAHEIQNPLNFVNNFSEINKELLNEMKEELEKGNIAEAKILADDAIENELKISHHGKRADSIVKGMLLHSRVNAGQKELADINALADEYLRLSYHGLRAKDKSFNASIQTDFDTTIGKIPIVPQEIGRVLLNLFNNAFYAISEKRSKIGAGFEPAILVSSSKEMNAILIKIKDNGNGVPKILLDKIFQPFFTTKPTGQGTGLGLSLSYDIIKAHNGELVVNTIEGEGAEFLIRLPLS